MESGAQAVELSPLEEARFGIRTARAPALTVTSLPSVLAFCRAERVRLLIARCRTDDLDAAQALEDAGGRLMDTLVYYARDLRRTPLPSDPRLESIRSVRSADVDALVDIARDAFRGYGGHYHADPRLDRRACDETYVSWIRRSCESREVAADVLVCDIDGAPGAFATMRMNSPEEGEGVLFGVAPRAQGQGVYRALIAKGLAWCHAKDASRMVVSTQVTNLAVQKVWVRLGFEPGSSYYTFHAWLDAT
jgi:GNAT superfamily N-acetyltransferase